MARSIHTTRRSARRLRRTEFSDVEAKEKLLTKAKEELDRKRLIKRQVKRERKQPAPPLAGTPTETIPVEILDVGPYVHHGLNEEDVRAMLAQLPAQATEGISRIQLCLGTEYLKESMLAGRASADLVDPFTDRISHRVLPGVFCAPVLGTYSPSSGRVSVFAFVCDLAALTLPASAVEAYLKLKALSTLLHEIAHHHDEVARVRRGRWLADREETVERYAEGMEYQWVRELAVPYVAKKCGAGVAALIDWVESHGGARLEVGFFVGDPRQTGRGGVPSKRPATNYCFQDWAVELDLNAPLAIQRLAFAREIHYAPDYQLCLRILEVVLADEPGSEAALTLKADTLGHLRRYEEARGLAESLLARNPANSDAWQVCANAAEKTRAWEAMLAVSVAWGENVEADTQKVPGALVSQAIAECALGREAALATTIASVMEILNRIRPLSAKRHAAREATFRKGIRRRAGFADPA